ncbi:MAG: 50S ribosomal protein L11 methyltransferase [Xanthomonadales bacterium]|nr:50S ribosomal protein L11 methyltransferase [Xanthomonadales bacterium]ODU91990.1 MAG: ribosomal protein L11 methyltransferase [Rhodanobacter sp. SCN 66-43]OJY84954.1 MAG: ribosomal protein L11 methyltransferase [Xanthomonadales bacterium 66-474]
MPWLELQLTTDAAAQPRAEAVLEELGALSVTLMDADADTPDEAAIFEPGVGETPLWRSLTLLALFDADSDRRGIVHLLHDALPELAPDRVAFREVADRDWERAWMDRYRPMPFGRRLWIYPWNIEPPCQTAPHPLPSPASGGRGDGVARSATTLLNEAPVIVRLDPGLAFGTGTHPTTALCLEWLDACDLADKTIIDYGCGSGVLAIAALKLGAARALGVDNDPQALTASRDNAVRNGVATRLSLHLPDELPDATRADAFVANILSGPLHALAARFAALCKPGAPFALSGILAGQEAELLERYAACGFADLHAARREDWVRIAGRYRGQA